MSHSLVFHHCHCCLPPLPSSPDLPMSTTTSNLSPLSTTATSSASHIWLHSGYLGLSPTIWVTHLSLYQADLPMSTTASTSSPMLPPTIALPYYPTSHNVMYTIIYINEILQYVPASGHNTMYQPVGTFDPIKGLQYE